MGIEVGGSPYVKDSFGPFLKTLRERERERFEERYNTILSSHDENQRTRIYQLITNERVRQDYLHGSGLETPLAVLGEEFGEVCKAIFEGKDKDLVEELIHVAAVAVKWLEELEV